MPSSMSNSLPSGTETSSSGSGEGRRRKLDPPPSFVVEAQQSLLYFRVVDSESPNPVLGDVYAKQIINRINLTTVLDTMAQDLRYVEFWCNRAKKIDDWCQAFIDAHPYCTVLNINCGLDTRFLRLSPGPRVRWIDIDHPEIVDFRVSVFPRPSGDYQLMAADIPADDYTWLESFPDDRPTLLVAESNLFYLRPEVARSIIYHAADHFTLGQFAFDVLGSLCARLINMKVATVQKKTGMKVTWPLNDPKTLLAIHPKISLTDEMRYSDDMPPWFGEFKTKLLKRLPAYRNLGRCILLSFGPRSKLSMTPTETTLAATSSSTTMTTTTTTTTTTSDENNNDHPKKRFESSPTTTTTGPSSGFEPLPSLDEFNGTTTTSSSSRPTTAASSVFPPPSTRDG